MRLSFPYGVAVDDSGTLIVADSGNSQLLLISPSGSSSVISKGGTPYGVTIHPNGSIVYYTDVDNQISKITFCPSGYYESTGECLKCQAGTYSYTHSLSCLSCDEGMKSDESRTGCICSDQSNFGIHILLLAFHLHFIVKRIIFIQIQPIHVNHVLQDLIQALELLIV